MAVHFSTDSIPLIILMEFAVTRRFTADLMEQNILGRRHVGHFVEGKMLKIQLINWCGLSGLSETGLDQQHEDGIRCAASGPTGQRPDAGSIWNSARIDLGTDVAASDVSCKKLRRFLLTMSLMDAVLFYWIKIWLVLIAGPEMVRSSGRVRNGLRLRWVAVQLFGVQRLVHDDGDRNSRLGRCPPLQQDRGTVTADPFKRRRHSIRPGTRSGGGQENGTGHTQPFEFVEGSSLRRTQRRCPLHVPGNQRRVPERTSCDTSWHVGRFVNQTETQRNDRGSSHGSRVVHEAHGDGNAAERRMPGRLGVDRSSNFGFADARVSSRDGHLRTQTVVRVSRRGLEELQMGPGNVERIRPLRTQEVPLQRSSQVRPTSNQF